MNGIIFLQLIGAVTGMIGSSLVTSLDRDTRLLAFLCWIVSNLSIIGAFYSMGVWPVWPLLLTQVFYFATSIVGAWKNRPVKKDLFPDA